MNSTFTAVETSEEQLTGSAAGPKMNTTFSTLQTPQEQLNASAEDFVDALEDSTQSVCSVLAEYDQKLAEMSHLKYKLFVCKEIMKIYSRNQSNIKDVPSGVVSLSNSVCQGDCETSMKLKTDLDSIKRDHDELYREYATLFENYGKVRQAAYCQRGEIEKMGQAILKGREEQEYLKTKFLRLKENASHQLSRASQEMDEVERKHSSDTQGLRMKVRTLEMELKNSRNEVKMKAKEIEEMRQMVATLLNEVEPASDVESESGI